MEKFPQPVDRIRVPVEITISPRLYDHHIEGRPVLSAAEAMHYLAVSGLSRLPDINSGFISGAAFDRFLFIPPDEKHITAFNDMEIYHDRAVSRLTTQTRPKKTTIIRNKEHVRLVFSRSSLPDPKTPAIIPALPSSGIFTVAPDRIYADLVPFGPAYRNIAEPLAITSDMAVAGVSGGFADSSDSFPLGSPFPLDAAFHAACVWGQRYANVVAFPVGFEERRILKPACFGETFTAWAVPVQRDPRLLIFDIRIYGADGELRESVFKVRMKDVSNGRMRPPEWIKEK